MKLYVVTADAYVLDCLGSEIKLFGVYTDETQAYKRKHYLENKFGYEPFITELSADEDIEEYLGGYIE